ncbi:hypothetical protein ABE137_00055 [Brevibacillus laterosporus]|nr:MULTISPECIES: hypothetical protein [Brevibacillus]MCR8984421.1 hypothetical protein [Brevibacillus laterosporus]
MTIEFSGIEWDQKTVKGGGIETIFNPSRKIDKNTGKEIVDSRFKKILDDFGDSKQVWPKDNFAEF